jgi:hypothetical protein
MRMRSDRPGEAVAGCVAGASARLTGRLAAARFFFGALAAAGAAGDDEAGLGFAALVDLLGDAAGADSAGAGFDLGAFGVAPGRRFFSVIAYETGVSGKV